MLKSPKAVTVIATARNSAEANELNALARRAKGRLRVVALDAVDRESIRACADEIVAMLWESEGIDYLVVNAEMVRINVGTFPRLSGGKALKRPTSASS